MEKSEIRAQKWAGEPRPGDAAGAYSYEQLLRMDGDFTAALERAFAAGLESPLSGAAHLRRKGLAHVRPGGTSGVSAAATPFSSFSTCLASFARQQNTPHPLPRTRNEYQRCLALASYRSNS
jgi:hypothetical protein